MDSPTNPYLTPASNPEEPVSRLPGTMPSVYGPYRDARGRARIVIILLALNGIIYLAFGGINVLYYNVLKAAELDLKKAESIESMMMICGFAMIIVSIITIVYFCMWTNLMMKNTWAIRGGHQLATPGWAVGWYFIPILNLWKPLGAVQQMRDAVYGSSGGLSLAPWWAFWLISNFIDKASGKMPSETIEDLQASAFFDACTTPINLISVVLAILMVKKLTTRQHAVATGEV